MAVDLKSNSFGLLIAYVIPGFFLVHGMSFYNDDLQRVFSNFLDAKSDIGLFFLLLIFAIGAGLLISSVRYLIYELLIFKPNEDGIEKEAKKNGAIKESDTSLAYFRMVVDEQYRYHQFYGGMALVEPMYLAGIILSYGFSWLVLILGIIIIVITVHSSLSSYKRMREYLKQ